MNPNSTVPNFLYQIYIEIKYQNLPLSQHIYLDLRAIAITVVVCQNYDLFAMNAVYLVNILQNLKYFYARCIVQYFSLNA